MLNLFWKTFLPGAAFTRLQTLHFVPRFPEIFNGNGSNSSILLSFIFFLDRRIVSYGPCQFPTLGFVVERFKQHINFVREPFWKLVLTHTKDKVKVGFGFLAKNTFIFDKFLNLLILLTKRKRKEYYFWNKMQKIHSSNPFNKAIQFSFRQNSCGTERICSTRTLWQ